MEKAKARANLPKAKVEKVHLVKHRSHHQPKPVAKQRSACVVVRPVIELAIAQRPEHRRGRQKAVLMTSTWSV